MKTNLSYQDRFNASRHCVRLTMRGFACLALPLACAGPQPLSVAIRQSDHREYVQALNDANGNARVAHTKMMALARGATPESVTQADSLLSTTKNPFDAHRDPEAVSRGGVIYAVHCARCHGNAAQGVGPSTLRDHPATNFRTFGKRFAATLHRGAPKKWFRIIRDGSGASVVYPDGASTAMPPFGASLTREQIWLVITYLQSLDIHAVSGENAS